MAESRAESVHVPTTYPEKPDDALIEASAYTLAGQTVNFNAYYDPALGSRGQRLANDILSSCESDYTILRGYFGNITPAGLPFNAYVTSGNRGASHQTCAATLVYLGANSSRTIDGDGIREMLLAEVVEVLEAKLGRWFCGWSPGEGLSRVLGAERYRMDRVFVTAPGWLDSNRPNWIDHYVKTDTDYLANGCSVLFLNWLRYALGFSWPAIVAAGRESLAETYTQLTRRSDAWAEFRRIIDGRFPPGRPSGLHNDNPFHATPNV